MYLNYHDEDLELDPRTNAAVCLQTFLFKGGSFHDSVRPKLLVGDAVYPVCSGGVCRSQTLWALLKPWEDKIVLFPPHAARHGWDPYNGKINRYRNLAMENLPDEFSSYFGMEKAERFGFENQSVWENMSDSERLPLISDYYRSRYFGPASSWKGSSGQRRVYIAFANNVHVVLHQLNQANEHLDKVVVYAIDWEDLITHPPEELGIVSRSRAAYAYFAHKLDELLDLSALSLY